MDDTKGEERGSNSGEGLFDQSNGYAVGRQSDGFENFDQARPQTLFDLQEQQNSQEWREAAPLPHSQQLEITPVAAFFFKDE